MTKTITALFDDKGVARGAVNELIDGGFDPNQISLVAQSDGDQTVTSANNLHTSATTETKAIVHDAGIGAIVGGAGGLILGLAALAIPGIGPIVAAGPIAAALAGLGVGAATGGLVGAMEDLGLSYEQLEYYAEGVRRGNTLVTVHTDEANFEKAQEILNRHHPVDLEQRKAEWLKDDVAAMPAETAPLSASSTGVATDTLPVDSPLTNNNPSLQTPNNQPNA
ncbi:MAG: hypothetical protein NT075_23805 [Chloroflexi bacterium]|nr:hypothetical protein [Chloroflexota bacterium]